MDLSSDITMSYICELPKEVTVGDYLMTMGTSSNLVSQLKHSVLTLRPERIELQLFNFKIYLLKSSLQE